jgi:hypothetical protein
MPPEGTQSRALHFATAATGFARSASAQSAPPVMPIRMPEYC